jgi:hypothetical protein
LDFRAIFVRTATIEYWDFDQNGNAAVQQDPFVIKPGDGFRTSCYFNANEDTIFAWTIVPGRNV